ncbi:Lon protease [Bombiscardovia coagulans]|uniref:Lon protease n=2 Tax=Bombiscardovia coagulans TaxID=686666 RepID=A0A261EPB9_9BIFI|nr:Lon protease [Bombiscardovia coagulans]
MGLMTYLHAEGSSYAASAQATHQSTGVDSDPHVPLGTLIRPKKESRAHRRRRTALAITLFLAVFVFIAPSPYVVEAPGPTQDVLGSSGSQSVITVKGAPTYHSKADGKLLLTTVNAAGLSGGSGIQTLIGWADPHATVLPKEVVMPPDQSVAEYEQANHKAMTSSQDVASAQALQFLRSRGKNTAGIKIFMHVDDIGGPSAGLMYTLGAIDKLTPQDETAGQVIAGTGTMNKDGTVGEIGGIRLKMIGARRDGASWFLAPADNCKEVVGNVPQGLRDVRVSTLEEAYTALTEIGQGRGDALPHCTTVAPQ